MSGRELACRFYLGGGSALPRLCNKAAGHVGPHTHHDRLPREWIASQAPPLSGQPAKQRRRDLEALPEAPQLSLAGVVWLTAPKLTPSEWQVFDAYCAELEKL